MDRLDLLLNARNEMEFFVVLFNILKSLGGLQFQIVGVTYNNEYALKIPFREIVVKQTGNAEIFGSENTHTFLLTQSGVLVWMIHGDPQETITGLANIQARLRHIQESSRGEAQGTAGFLEHTGS